MKNVLKKKKNYNSENDWKIVVVEFLFFFMCKRYLLSLLLFQSLLNIIYYNLYRSNKFLAIYVTLRSKSLGQYFISKIKSIVIKLYYILIISAPPVLKKHV